MGWQRSIGLAALATTATAALLFAAVPAEGHDVLLPNDGGKAGAVTDPLDGAASVTIIPNQPTLDDLVRSALTCTQGHHSVLLQLVFQQDGRVRAIRVFGRDDKTAGCVKQVFARARVTPFAGDDRGVGVVVLAL